MRKSQGLRKWGIAMDENLKPDFGTNVYIFAAVGAVLGGLAGASMIGFPSAIGAIVIGALAGGALGYFMLKV
jgi:outer membrane lipoprotein SlyB